MCETWKHCMEKTKEVGTLRHWELVQKINFYRNMVQMIFQDLRWILNNFFKNLKFGHLRI